MFSFAGEGRLLWVIVVGRGDVLEWGGWEIYGSIDARAHVCM